MGREGRRKVPRVKAERLRRVVTRRTIRAALRTLLSPGRLVRLDLESASNAIPVLDAVGDAAMAVDLAEMAGEFSTLADETRAAQAFVEKGPQDLSSLLVSSQEEGFASFDAFKKLDLVKRFGPAG